MKQALSQKVLRLPVWLWAVVFVAACGGGIFFLVSQPDHAGWRYGACKALLEQYVRFPTTIKIEQGGETQGSAFISFADINPFGAQQIRVFECYFTQSPDGGTALSRLTMDRKALPDDVVKKFSAMLPILSSQKLDTALPKDLPSDLKDLKD